MPSWLTKPRVPLQYLPVGSMFKVNCVQCHGSGAQGGPGFPNLNDDSWIWGGKPEQIVQTISHGVRQDGNDNTRANVMPAFGKDGLLEPAKIEEVTNHVPADLGSGT